MKKLTSVILSVLMVVSLFSCVFTGTTVSAEQTATNLIVNGDFESFNVNTAGNNTALPGLGWRSVKSAFPTDKTKGQWYRSTGGLAPSVAPDLDANYSKITDTAIYPTYFGANDQMVLEPGVEDNHVLRAVQDLYTQVEPKDNGEYALTFRFKLPNNDTGLSFFNLFFVSPKLNSDNGQSIQNSLRFPFSITSAELGSKTTTGITATLAETNADNNDGYKYNRLRIDFDTNNTDWQTVEVAIKTEKVTHENAKPDVYTVDETDYTSPVLVKIGFDTDGINLSDKITDETITNATSYRKKAIYFDDFAMYENINPFEDAKFYNKADAELTNINEYVGINKTVNGEKVIALKVGDEVTATPDYNKDCNVFAGWFKNGALFSREESVTFTVNDTDKYYPRFINKNLLTTSAASYENYAAKESLVVTDHTKYPEAGQWGVNFTNGYFRATKHETIYDKDHKSYQQRTTDSSSTDTRTVTVDDTKSYKGSKSLKLENNWATLSTGLEVKQHTEYTLTYYVMADGFKDNTTKKLKTHGIATTLNICDSYRPVPQDGGTLNLGVALGNFSTANVALVAQTGIDVSNWTKITLSFNSGEFKKLYFVIAPVDSETYWIDELSLVENTSETVDVQFMNTKGEDITAECANEAKPAITNSANPGYLVANADYDDNAFDFKGWYNGDTLLSTDKSFEFVSGTYTTLTAKVVSRNILSSTASFEGYNVDGTEYKVNGSDTTKKPDYPSGNLWGTNANNGYYNTTYQDIIYDNTGKAYQQTSGNTQNSTTIGHATVSDAQYKSGSKSLRIDFSWRAASLGIDVTPNTDYKLSYYYYTAAGQSIFEKVPKNQLKTAVVTTVNVGTSTTATAEDGSTINVALANALSDNSLIALGTATSEARTTLGGEWKKVDISFNSGNLSKVYLVVASDAYNGKTETGADDNRALDGVWIDNMTMIKCDPATLTVDYMKSCASIDPVGCDLDNLFVDQNVQFKVIHNQANAPVVEANNTVITADSNGIYSFKANQNNTLSVHFEGDGALNDHDKGYNGEILSEYNDNVYLTSIWEGDTVYQEPALFVGETETKQLLYPVDKIVSLRSYDLKTNYVEGVDYKVVDGKIQRLDGSRIPLYTEPLTTTDKPSVNVFPLKDKDNEYLRFIGDTVFPQYAVSVTYEHSTTFADGYTPAAPASQTEKLQKTIDKLNNGEEVNIVIYGDSISTGRSSSGQNSTKDIYTANNKEGEFANLVINVAPYAPTWIDMFITELRERYPTATINLKNLSLGGMGSEWGAKNIAARLALWKDEEGNTITPDLMLIGFGVNDSAGNVTKSAYKNNIQSIINTARTNSGNQNMEVLLYSPMLPNQKATTWDKTKLIAYENALEEIAQEDTKIGLLKLTSIFTEIIKSKDCVDYLNTNVNHGNDFTARIYATGLLTAMSGESITEYLGTAIRAANGDKKQALRYKFSVSKDLINGNSDYGTLVEYGSIAIPSSYLEGAELIKDGKYKNSKGNIVSPVKGITYSKGGNHTIFAEDKDNNKYIFTAALYNIGYNKTTKTTNYTAWGNDYSVRNYAIFEDETGNTKTVYDATIAVSSVFKVMNQIESAYESYELDGTLPNGITDAKKLENDYKTVKSILGDANSEQSKAYQAWCNENVDYTLTCTVTADTTDGDAGYVVRVGRSYFAVPYTGNEFIGWYKADKTTQISTDTSLTIADINKNHGGTVVAKFKDNNLLSDIGAGAEKLTTAPTMYNTKNGGPEPPETGNYFYTGASWSDMVFTTNSAYVHSGSKAFSMLSRNQGDARIVVRGLKKKTQYGVSFWWKNQASGSEYYFSGMAAVPTTTTSWNTAKSTNLGGVTETVYTNEALDWNYTEFTFNTGDNTEVNLCYQYYAGDSNSKLVFDELTLYELPNQEDYITYNVSVSAENGVAYQSALNGTVKGNTSVNLVCSPNNQNAKFLGWYDGETEVSKQRTLTLEVNKDYNLIAKFTEGTKYADTKSGANITNALQETGYYDTLFERAIKNKGNQALIANMLKKAQNGDDITIVGLGGSITQGAGSSAATNNSYGKLVANWLQETFKDKNYSSTVTYKNAGIGATTSDLGLARMEAQVLKHNPDLVIVDFTTNDQNEERYRYTYEALIRKLMEQNIATVAIMFGPVVPENYSADKTCIKRPNRTDLHFPSLLYYDIPVIDYYGAMWDYLDSNRDGKSDSNDLAQWTELWNDYIHPNDAGHKLSANAINYYLKTVLENIDSISTDLPEVPQELFYANTASYIGSTMYDNSNIGAKLKGSSNVVIEDYGNVDANTQSQWKTWKISEGGYIEFTLPSCKSFTILRVQQPNGGKANITINGKLFKQDNSYQSSGQLNWSSATYYGDGETPTTIRIECIDDGDNATNTFYQISCVFIAE